MFWSILHQNIDEGMKIEADYLWNIMKHFNVWHASERGASDSVANSSAFSNTADA